MSLQNILVIVFFVVCCFGVYIVVANVRRAVRVQRSVESLNRQIRQSEKTSSEIRQFMANLPKTQTEKLDPNVVRLVKKLQEKLPPSS
jgi:cell division protein FtsL